MMDDPFPGRSLAEVFGTFTGRTEDDLARSKVFDRLVADGMDPATPVHLCGWRDIPERRALAATFAPPLSRVAPHLMGDAQDVLLFRAWKEALGSYPSYVAQQIGDCFLPTESIRLPGRNTKWIADVQVGDEVLTHLDRPRKVTRTIRKPYSGDMVSFGVHGAYLTVSSTPDHRFATADGDWIAADCVRDGMRVRFAHTGELLGAHTVEGVSRGTYDGDVCCLEVEEDHSFQANGYACHNCTSFGSGHALDLLQCVEIVLGHEPLEYRETCTEAIYAMGREIANMLGGGDGCYGVAVAKALTDGGATTRQVVGPYSGRRAKEWGSRGVPAEIREKAKPFRVGSAALLTTLDELDAALANLYPSAGGFSQGFAMHRDSDGVCRQSGRWGHEQCCIGRRTRNGRRQYLLGQSWGPNVPDGPTTDDQPDFSFWIDGSAMADILSQRDWLAFSRFPGFATRDVPVSFRYSADVA